MCVNRSPGGEQCERIMRWFFQASISDCSNPRLCCLLLCIIPSPSRFPNPRHSHHTGSYTHLGVPCLRTSISDCHTRSFAHLGVACLRPSILITHPDLLYLPVAVLLHAHLPTFPPPPFSFTWVFQGGTKSLWYNGYIIHFTMERFHFLLKFV